MDNLVKLSFCTLGYAGIIQTVTGFTEGLRGFYRFRHVLHEGVRRFSIVGMYVVGVYVLFLWFYAYQPHFPICYLSLQKGVNVRQGMMYCARILPDCWADVDRIM